MHVLLELFPRKGKQVFVFFLSFGSTFRLTRAAVGEKYLCLLVMWIRLLLLSVGLPVANTPDVLQPCGLLYYP